MRRVVALGALFGAVIAGWSCIDTCTPGRTEACACTDGRVGAQVCRSNGAFDPCICTGGVVDAGSDAGNACLSNLNPPSFSDLGASRVASVAPGQPLKLTINVQDFDRDPLEVSVAVLQDDAGVPDASVNLLASRAEIELPGVGDYEVEVAVSDGCHVTRRRWPVTVVPARRLPFIISDFACCDAEGRGFGISQLRAEVVRLSPDGGQDTMTLQRLPTSLTFDSKRERLVVGQDGYVSFIRLSTFTREDEWQVDTSVSAVIADDTTAWVFGRQGTNGDEIALRVRIDGGTVLAQNTLNAPSVKRGFFSADAGWFVIHDGSWIRTRPVSISFPVSGGYEQACEQIWETGRRTRFFSGCGQSYEVRADGGLAYGGMLPSVTRLDALGESSTGDLSLTWFQQVPPMQLLRTVNGVTLSAKSEFPIGLTASNLVDQLKPKFLMPQADGHVHVLTPDAENDATWWQEF
jgi:hypothetical protein